MMFSLKRFLRDESAPPQWSTAPLAGLISVAIIVSLKSVGTKLNTKFGATATALNGPPALAIMAAAN